VNYGVGFSGEEDCEMREQNGGKNKGEDELTDLKAAVRKLSNLSNRIFNLTSKKQLQVFGALEGEGESGANIEEEVQHFSEFLADFLKLRKKLRSSFSAFQKSLKDLEGATEADEISTLAGFNVLTGQKEYRRIIDKMMETNSQMKIPKISDVERVIKLAKETDDVGRWMRDMSSYDSETEDDDFTRMIIALRDRNVKGFNEIYEKIEKKIAAEEHK
jgi:hypothetical protein